MSCKLQAKIVGIQTKLWNILRRRDMQHRYLGARCETLLVSDKYYGIVSLCDVVWCVQQIFDGVQFTTSEAWYKQPVDSRNSQHNKISVVFYHPISEDAIILRINAAAKFRHVR